ncbi:hypothetical protein A4H97_27205 [Niastella yeongjuensis]|uniref:DUF4296 domain-containing protein n=1 Tax=Niastella yeongjuensis TaxID=354355 RepID=A0A1V9EYS3_9BACT|nr:DUF4296 domain-containing protein [Niastella yeongjuensis]OQP51270.1 hypothetical protein A4H97_27205 [Niastella yeongjuensis]SEP39375.1 protein of unknown function [Niastella yeongjuensis]
MSRLLLVCLSAIVWCLVSCTDKDKVPKGVLGKEKMQKVLMEMIQAERYNESFIAPDSSKDSKKETFKLYAQVFELNKITKDEFIKSYKFYMSRPDMAKGIFDSLSMQTNKLRENLNKPLDTAAKAKSAVDSAKAKTADSLKSKTAADSLKVKPADSAKIQTPQPTAPPPSHAALPRVLGNRRAALGRFRVKDTLLRLNRKPGQ